MSKYKASTYLTRKHIDVLTGRACTFTACRSGRMLRDKESKQVEGLAQVGEKQRATDAPRSHSTRRSSATARDVSVANIFIMVRVHPYTCKSNAQNILTYLKMRFCFRCSKEPLAECIGNNRVYFPVTILCRQTLRKIHHLSPSLYYVGTTHSSRWLWPRSCCSNKYNQRVPAYRGIANTDGVLGEGGW